MQSKQCPARRACQARRAVATPIARPVTTAACAPCGARNSVVGRYEAATAAAGPAEPAAVVAVAAPAAATRQDKARQLAYFRRYSGRYPGDTLKWKKRTPRHQSPSSFQHNHFSKFQSDKTQCDQIPHGTDTIGKFQTCKNAGKSINNQNHVFQTQAGRSTHRLPQFFPPN